LEKSSKKKTEKGETGSYREQMEYFARGIPTELCSTDLGGKSAGDRRYGGGGSVVPQYGGAASIFGRNESAIARSN
jgi:hypothetical protein